MDKSPSGDMGIAESAFVFYEDHAKVVAVGAFVFALALFLIRFWPYIVLADRPTISKQTSQTKGIGYQLNVYDFSPELAQLRSRSFSLYFSDSEPFKAYAASCSGTYCIGDSDSVLGWGYHLTTSPEQGADPRKWQLLRSGDFPFEVYKLVYVFGFNRSMGFSEMDISARVLLPSGIDEHWRVDQRLTRITLPDNSTLLSWGIEASPIAWYIQGNSADCYRFDVILSRDNSQAYAFAAIIWIPSAILTVGVAFAGSLSRKLSPSAGLGLYGLIATGALGHFYFVFQNSPAQFAPVQILLLLDFVASIVFLFLNLSMKRIRVEVKWLGIGFSKSQAFPTFSIQSISASRCTSISMNIVSLGTGLGTTFILIHSSVNFHAYWSTLHQLYVDVGQ